MLQRWQLEAHWSMHRSGDGHLEPEDACIPSQGLRGRAHSSWLSADQVPGARDPNSKGSVVRFSPPALGIRQTAALHGRVRHSPLLAIKLGDVGDSTSRSIYGSWTELFDVMRRVIDAAPLE